VYKFGEFHDGTLKALYYSIGNFKVSHQKLKATTDFTDFSDFFVCEIYKFKNIALAAL
jgi:hypothetical protein